MKRTKLADRKLPEYSLGEERLHVLSHGAGIALGVIALILCILKAAQRQNIWGIVGGSIYGGSMILLYTMSSVYHGLKPGLAKKVMQVIDHCTIYFLISGSYTPVLLSALRPGYPALAWSLLVFEWGLTALAVTLTAIDLKRYSVFSMACYIGMGWAIIPFAGAVMEVTQSAGFYLLLAGGIAYTVGAVTYGLGKKRKWMHGVFHIFVVIGSFLQFLAVWGYAL